MPYGMRYCDGALPEKEAPEKQLPKREITSVREITKELRKRYPFEVRYRLALEIKNSNLAERWRGINAANDAAREISKTTGENSSFAFNNFKMPNMAKKLIRYVKGEIKFDELMLYVLSNYPMNIEIGGMLDYLHTKPLERQKYLDSLSTNQVLALLLSNPNFFYPSSNHMLFNRLKRDLGDRSISDLFEEYNLFDTDLGRNFILRAINYGRLYGKENSLYNETDIDFALDTLLAPVDAEKFNSTYFFLLANCANSIMGIETVRKELHERLCKRLKGIEEREGTTEPKRPLRARYTPADMDIPGDKQGEPTQKWPYKEDEKRLGKLAGIRIMPLHAQIDASKIVKGKEKSERRESYITSDERPVKKTEDPYITSDESRIAAAIRYLLFKLDPKTNMVSEKEKAEIKKCDEKAYFNREDYTVDGKLRVIQILYVEKKFWDLINGWYERDYRKPTEGKYGGVIYETGNLNLTLFRGSSDEIQRFIKKQLEENPNMIISFDGHIYNIESNIPFNIFGDKKGHVLFVIGSCGSCGYIPWYMEANKSIDWQFFTTTTTGNVVFTNIIVSELINTIERKKLSDILTKIAPKIEASGGDANSVKACTPGETLLTYVYSLEAVEIPLYHSRYRVPNPANHPR